MPVFDLGWTLADGAASASLWAIRLALVCMAVHYGCLIGSARNRRGLWGAPSIADSPAMVAANPRGWSDWLWLAGAILAAGHTLSALAVFHGWSHRQAVLATEDQTEALLGMRVGAGVYVNYVFVVIWLIDAMWLLAWRRWRLPRPPKAWTIAVHAFLIFIAINGAIVFARGPIRWISLALLVALGGAWVRLLLRPTAAEDARLTR